MTSNLTEVDLETLVANRLVDAIASMPEATEFNGDLKLIVRAVAKTVVSYYMGSSSMLFSESRLEEGCAVVLDALRAWKREVVSRG